MSHKKKEGMSCNLCGSTKHSRMYRVDSYDIVRCNNCELVYLAPIPSPKDLRKNNQRVYGSKKYKQMCEDYRHVLTKRYKKRLIEINKLRPAGGQLLDIGCSTGTFLKVAESYNIWECTGIEINNANAEYARSVMRLKIINSDLKEAKLPDKSIDTVTMWDCLEHTANPSEHLLEIRRILKDDGILALQLPNIESFVAKLRKDQWEWLTPPDHLYHFSPQTITSLLENNGFKVVRAKTEEQLETFSNSLLTHWAVNNHIKPVKKLLLNVLRKAYSLFYPLSYLVSQRGRGSLLVLYAQPDEKI